MTSGGGVQVNQSTFTMSGSATVSGNTATNSGGGVGIWGGGSGSSFIKTGGVIYGSDELDPALRNVVKNSAGVEQPSSGAAVAVGNQLEKTVGADKNLTATWNGSTWTYTPTVWSD
jgi:hypothetical protein